MNASQRYKQQDNLVGKSRIELLTMVYDRLIMFLERAQHFQSLGQESDMVASQLEAQRMLLGLAAGIDLDSGDLAVNVMRLLEFISHRLTSRDWDTAIRITNQLKETYRAISNEVEALEQSGQLPTISTTPVFQVSV